MQPASLSLFRQTTAVNYTEALTRGVYLKLRLFQATPLEMTEASCFAHGTLEALRAVRIVHSLACSLDVFYVPPQ